MEQFVLNNADASDPYLGVPPVDTKFGNSDAKIALLPPGSVDVRVRSVAPLFDININACVHMFALNSDRRSEEIVAAESMAFFPGGTEISLATTNVLPGCIVEMSDTTLAQWIGEADGRANRMMEATTYRPDGVSADFGRAAIRFLRSTPNDTLQNRMILEALALGVSARAFALLIAPDGDADAEMDTWKSRGNRRRVQRAVDWAEAYLLDSSLSVSSMATAAGLSSCHFGVVFKSQMGESPYAYVLRRRAQFARDMIEGTDESIAQVAYATGFSSQAHLTTVMRRVLGVTPGKLRSMN